MKEKLKNFFAKKSVKTVLVLLIALALLLAVWRVFFSKGETTDVSAQTEEENRLSRLLEKIEGVEEASVMIGEKDGVPVSAVIVFQGEDGILVRTRLTEAAAQALGISNREVHVFPSDRK